FSSGLTAVAVCQDVGGGFVDRLRSMDVRARSLIAGHVAASAARNLTPSAFAPVRTMPAWLRGFAAHQPITPVTDALRALLVGAPAGSSVWIALARCRGARV